MGKHCVFYIQNITESNRCFQISWPISGNIWDKNGDIFVRKWNKETPQPMQFQTMTTMKSYNNKPI